MHDDSDVSMLQTVSTEQKKCKCLEKLSINLTAGERAFVRMAPNSMEAQISG